MTSINIWADDRIMSDFEWPVPCDYPEISEHLSFDVVLPIIDTNITYSMLCAKGVKICDIVYDGYVSEIFLYTCDKIAVFVAPDKCIESFFAKNMSIRSIIDYHYGHVAFADNDLYDKPMSEIYSFFTIIVE